MQNLGIIIIFLILVLSAVSFASDSTSIIGSTGLIRMPAADIVGDKQFNLGIDYGARVIAGTGTISATGSWSYKVNLGVLSGMELGIIGGTLSGGTALKEGVLVNMKYSLASDSSVYPLKLALGAENLTSSNEADTYLVATKYMKGGWVLHLGAMFDFPNGRFRPLGMAGIEYPLGGSGSNVFLLGEVFAGESLLQVDAGLRLSLFPKLDLKLDGLNLSNSQNSKNSQSVSAGFSWKNPF